MTQLQRDIEGWINTRNENPRPSVGVKTADEILALPAKYCSRISDAAH